MPSLLQRRRATRSGKAPAKPTDGGRPARAGRRRLPCLRRGGPASLVLLIGIGQAAPDAATEKAGAGEARIRLVARRGDRSIERFAVALLCGGAPFTPPRISADRRLPDGSFYAASGETIAVPPGAYEIRARYGRHTAPAHSATFATGEPTELELLFKGAGDDLPPEVVFVRGALPPPEIGLAEQCSFAPLPPGARAWDPAAMQAPAGLLLAPSPIATVLPSYIGLDGGAVKLVASSEPALTPAGWAPAPAARRTILPPGASAADLGALPPLSTGVTDGPSLALVAGASRPGDVIALARPTSVRVRALAVDPVGIATLTIRVGGEPVLAARGGPASDTLTVSGDLVLGTRSFLLATATNAEGRTAVSGVIRIEPREAGIQPAEKAPPAGAPILVSLLSSWTSPGRSYRIHAALRAERNAEGLLVARPGEGYRVVPLEVPVALRPADRIALSFELVPPDVREFAAAVPFALALGGETIAEANVLVCPWDIAELVPRGELRLQRQGPRLGYVLRELVVEIREPIKASKSVFVEIFSEGTSAGSIDARIEQPLPRRELSFSEDLPARRGWHTVTFDTRGAPLVTGNRIALAARSPGTLLVGAVRASAR